MSSKQVLGKGLASLLTAAGVDNVISGSGAVAAGPPIIPPPAPEIAINTSSKDRVPGILLLNTDEITANTFQPRREFQEQPLDELAQSVRENGIIQPLVVRKVNDRYELIAGERRLRAAKKAGLKQVPVVIRRSTDKESLQLAVIENVQRENLNCIDEALAYFQLLNEFSMTQEEIAHQVGKDRATVANFLRLLRLPQAVIDDLKIGRLSFGHGKALLGIEDSNLLQKLANEIIENGLSVRAAELRVQAVKEGQITGDSYTPPATGSSSSTPLKLRMQNLSTELTQHWMTRVECKGSDRRGKIVIHYGKRDELDRILHALQSNQKWHNPQSNP